MKKLALPALALGLALGACSDADTTATADDAANTAGVAASAPAADPAPVAGDAPADGADNGTTLSTDGNSVSIDGKDVDATVGEDGVEAKVKID